MGLSQSFGKITVKKKEKKEKQSTEAEGSGGRRENLYFFSVTENGTLENCTSDRWTHLLYTGQLETAIKSDRREH